MFSWRTRRPCVCMWIRVWSVLTFSCAERCCSLTEDTWTASFESLNSQQLMKWWSSRWSWWAALSTFTDTLWSFIAKRQWSGPSLITLTVCPLFQFTPLYLLRAQWLHSLSLFIWSRTIYCEQCAFRAASCMKPWKKSCWKMSKQAIPTLIKTLWTSHVFNL